MNLRNSFALPFLVSGLIIYALPAFARGNEGGGGGSSVKCGDGPSELADLYEFRVSRNPFSELVKLNSRFYTIPSRDDTEKRLADLRKMSGAEALEYVSTQLSAFLNNGVSGESKESTSNQVHQLLESIYYNHRLGLPTDPRDSGQLRLLPGCTEKRVAVNSGYNPYTNPKIGIDSITVIEDAWNEMTPFDRYGLIVHEALYAITEGRISIDSMDPLLKMQKTSQDVRKIVAMILMGLAPNALNLPFTPQATKSCWAGTAAVRRDHSTWDRVHFDISPSPSGWDGSSQISFTSMWGIVVLRPNYAHSDLEFSRLKLSGSDLLALGRVYAGPTKPYRVFELKDLGGPFAQTRTQVSFYPVLRPGQDSAPVVYLKLERVESENDGTERLVTLLDGPVSCDPGPQK